jgi:hypothetical protein
MKRGNRFAIFGIVLILPAIAMAETYPGFLKFSASTTLRKNDEHIVVHVGMFAGAAEDGGAIDRKNQPVWFQGTFSDRNGWAGPKRIGWTDSNRCPQALAELKKVRQIGSPKPILPMLPDDKEDDVEYGDVYVDGRVYELDVDSSNYNGQSAGEFHASSNVDTPLASWVEKMIVTLQPCWSREMPAGVDPDAGSGSDAALVRSRAEREGK